MDKYVCQPVTGHTTVAEVTVMVRGACQHAFFQVIFQQTLITQDKNDLRPQICSILRASLHAVDMGLLGDILVYGPIKI